MLFTGQLAHAQEAESAEYRKLVEQALSEYAGKNYEEASSLFARAHQLAPSARTQRGMGMAAFELRRYPESISLLQAALASDIKPLDATLRSETDALLARARGFCATVTVDVTPRSAQLLVDGNRVEAFTPLTLSLGEHVFELREAGHISERRVVRLGGGEVQSLRLALVPDALSQRSNTHEGTQRDDARPLRKNAWLWTGVGIVVAGAVTAGVLLATRGEDKTRTVAEGTANTPAGVSLATLGAR